MCREELGVRDQELRISGFDSRGGVGKLLRSYVIFISCIRKEVPQ